MTPKPEFAQATFRVYASSTCERCAAILRGLRALRLKVVELDAFAEEHQNILDRNSVVSLPLVQLVDDEDTVLWQKSGDQAVSLKDIVSLIY